MKEDKLEKFVRDHREDFDDEMPSAGAWEQLQQHIPATPARVFQLRTLMRVAAIILIGIISVGMLYYFNYYQEKPLVSTIHHDTVTIHKNVSVVPDKKEIAENHTVIKKGKFSQQTTKVKATNRNNSNVFPDELKEMQAYYTQQIENRRSEILRISSSDPEVAAQLKSEFSDIDRVNNDLKKDLNDGINSQEVAEAIILNYKSCLETLDSMLEQLKEKNV
jgi:hypothetical protein